ncbi:MAG: non-homologous end-joining DNA ligase [Gammaproteobacteria bacterium]|nr:non-homologous end-joining DNA ligase [Gammaproteobacteria bacterium]
MTMRRYGRYTVEVSNEDKVLFPDAGFTKGDLIDYYEAIAEHFLRHAAERPLTMQRFPEGISKDGFFQKQIGDYFPDWIARAKLRTRQGDQEQVLCNNRATLVYLANQACVTPHLVLSRIDRIERPDQLVFDLDPPNEEFAPVRRAAMQLRELLDELDLRSFVKTTGSRGLHVVVALRRDIGFDDVRDFAHDAASLLACRYDEELTVEQRKDKRRGRLYLDVGRNAYGQTAVAPYAVRAKPGAPVAAPIEWDELEDDSLHARTFDIANVPARLERTGDPWRALHRGGHSLRAAKRRLRELLEAERD